MFRYAIDTEIMFVIAKFARESGGEQITRMFGTWKTENGQHKYE